MNGSNVQCLHKDIDSYPLHLITQRQAKFAGRARKLLNNCLPEHVLQESELGYLPIPNRCKSCNTFNKAFSFAQGEVWIENLLNDRKLVESDQGPIFLYQYLLEAGYNTVINNVESGIQITIKDPVRFGRIQSMINLVAERFSKINIKRGHFIYEVQQSENNGEITAIIYFRHINIPGISPTINTNKTQNSVVSYIDVVKERIERINPCQGTGMCGKQNGQGKACLQCGVFRNTLDIINGEIQLNSAYNELSFLSSEDGISFLKPYLESAGYTVSISDGENPVLQITDLIRYGRFRTISKDIMRAFSYANVNYFYQVKGLSESDDGVNITITFLFEREQQT